MLIHLLLPQLAYSSISSFVTDVSTTSLLLQWISLSDRLAMTQPFRNTTSLRDFIKYNLPELGEDLVRFNPFHYLYNHVSASDASRIERMKNTLQSYEASSHRCLYKYLPRGIRESYDVLFTELADDLAESTDSPVRIDLPERVSYEAQIINLDSRIVAVGLPTFPAVIMDVDVPCAVTFNPAPGLFTLRVKMIAEHRVFAEIRNDALFLWLPFSQTPVEIHRLDGDENVFLRIWDLKLSNDKKNVYVLYSSDRKRLVIHKLYEDAFVEVELPEGGAVTAIDGDMLVHLGELVPIFDLAEPAGPYPSECVSSRFAVKPYPTVHIVEIFKPRMKWQPLCFTAGDRLLTLTDPKAVLLAVLCSGESDRPLELWEEFRTGLPCSLIGLEWELERLIAAG